MCVCVYRHTKDAVGWEEGSFVLQVRQEQGRGRRLHAEPVSP